MYRPIAIRKALADGLTHEEVSFHFAVSLNYLAKLTAQPRPQRPKRRERGLITFEQAAARYFAEVAPGTIKSAVATRYACSLRQLPPWFGPMPVKEIDSWIIADVVTERRRAGVSNATIKRDLTAASRVLSACVGWGELAENAALQFDRSVVRERREPITLPTDAEISTVVAASTPAAGSLISFLLVTGLRLNEATTLEWSRVDFNRAQITLTRTKNGRVRVVPLSGTAVATLQAQPRHPKSPYIFWHGAGAPYHEFSSNFMRLARKAGVKWSCHDLRHRFAVDYLRDGGNLYKLSKILGHGSVKTTEIYLDHLDPDEAMRARYGMVN